MIMTLLQEYRDGENVNSKQHEYQQQQSNDGEGGSSLDDNHGEYGGSSRQ